MTTSVSPSSAEPVVEDSLQIALEDDLGSRSPSPPPAPTSSWQRLWDKFNQCGADPNMTPLPWAQVSVATLVTTGEGMPSIIHWLSISWPIWQDQFMSNPNYCCGDTFESVHAVWSPADVSTLTRAFVAFSCFRHPAINNGILFPFVAFMVTDLFGYKDTDVGYYGGWIASSYFLAQIFSSVFLGQLSDMIGRRPIMLMGVMGNLLTTLLFGVSRVFWLALLSRFLCGLFNGNTGVVKSYVREITDDTNQTRAFTYRIAGFAIGAIGGPVLGGALARPALQYPRFFSPDGIFGYFPFLLPCLASALLSLITYILGFIFIQETVKFKVPQPVDLEAERSDLASSSLESRPQSPSSDVELLERRSKEQSNEENDRAGSNDAMPDDATSDSTSSEEARVELDLESPAPTRASSYRDSARFGELKTFLRKLRSQLTTFTHAFKDRDVSWSMALYALTSFIQLGADEVFSFWALRTVADGGLSFTPLQIGTVNGVSGVGMLLMQLFAYVPMDKKLGTRETLTVSSLVLAPILFLVPFVHALTDYNALMWISLCVLMMLKAGWLTMTFAAVNLLVNNAAAPAIIGAVNGLSASVGATARVISPVLMGSIFAATAASGLPFPLDYHCVFVLQALACLLLSIGAYFLLPKSINIRKK